MRRSAILAAVLLVGCGGTVVERVNSAIDTGCKLCETIAPLCSARSGDHADPPITVNVTIPGAPAPAPMPLPIPSVAPAASR